ncbi:MAG: OmpA family protein [Campylobacterales bacterium]
MKKLITLGSMSLLLLLSGCSQKSEVEKEPVVIDKEVEEVVTVQGGDNFLDMDKGQYANKLENELATIYFNFDKYNIRPDMQPKIETDADILGGADLNGYTVKLEGNCDEWGSDEYNYALGLKRAKTVRDSLSQRGVDTGSMILVSYGESNPVCTEHTKSCWAQNRRVNYDIIPE